MKLTRLFHPGSKCCIRILTDITIVNLCMLAVWFCLTAWRLASADLAGAHAVFADLPGAYLILCPLWALLPAGLLIAGVYDSRGRNAWTRTLSAVRTSLFVAVGYAGVVWILAEGHGWKRPLALWSAGLAVIAIAASRLIKNIVASQDDHSVRQHLSIGYRNGTVLVTGGAGYIGSLLVRRLLEQGYRVKVLDKLVYGREPLAGILGHQRLELIVGDCRNMQHVVQAVKECDSIVDLAAIVGDPACELDRQATLEINYAATRMLIEVAKGAGTRRFIFASSCSVYGAREETLNELSPPLPVSLYGQTKVDSEEALIAAATEEFQPTILRLATVFGHSHRPRFDLVVNLLTAKAYQDGTVTIYNGQQWRPFIHVRDVVEAILLILGSRQNLKSEIFNVGDSRLNFTLTEVGDKIQKAFPHARIERIDNDDRRDYRVSFEKIEKRIGFRAQWSLERGILEMANELAGGRIGDYQCARYSNQKYLQAAGSPRHADKADASIMRAFAAAAGR